MADIRTRWQHTLRHSLLAASVAFSSSALACTSLLYTDNNGAPYAGRTMELPMELPYRVAYFPVGSDFRSSADEHKALKYQSRYAFISVAVPDPLTHDLKVTEGMNEQGLTFSLLAFPSADGPADMVNKTRAVLAAIDLGSWTLGQFATVAEVKAALEKQPSMVTALLPFGTMKTPFHYSLHDATGKSLVIEYANGQQNLIDNPTGVMTNGPQFDWHMTNLNNYSFISNIDHSKLEISGITLQQPDSGIATVALPASNTSVGRFVRAFYYANFAEKAQTPEKAITTLAHVMNNFDRPRGITMDNRFKEEVANIAAPEVVGHPLYTSEYASWTSLMDLRQQQMHIRTYAQMNFLAFDLKALKSEKQKLVVELASISADSRNGNEVLLAAKAQ